MALRGYKTRWRTTLMPSKLSDIIGTLCGPRFAADQINSPRVDRNPTLGRRRRCVHELGIARADFHM